MKMVYSYPNGGIDGFWLDSRTRFHVRGILDLPKLQKASLLEFQLLQLLRNRATLPDNP